MINRGLRIIYSDFSGKLFVESFFFFLFGRKRVFQLIQLSTVLKIELHKLYLSTYEDELFIVTLASSKMALSVKVNTIDLQIVALYGLYEMTK